MFEYPEKGTEQLDSQNKKMSTGNVHRCCNREGVQLERYYGKE